MDFLNYNSVVIDNVAMLPSIETLPGYEAGAAFTVNSDTVFREDMDIMPTIVDDTSAHRSENLRGDLTQKRNEIVRQVKAQVVCYLRSGSFNSRRLANIVNYIRLNAESFKEWHKSVIARLRLF